MHDFKTRIALVNLINEAGLSVVLGEFADLVEGENYTDPDTGARLTWLHEMLKLAAGITQHSTFTVWLNQKQSIEKA